MRSARRARRHEPRRPKVGCARIRRHGTSSRRETDEISIDRPVLGDCESRLAPPPTRGPRARSSDGSTRRTDPSVHLECEWKPGPDRGSRPPRRA